MTIRPESWDFNNKELRLTTYPISTFPLGKPSSLDSLRLGRPRASAHAKAWIGWRVQDFDRPGTIHDIAADLSGEETETP